MSATDREFRKRYIGFMISHGPPEQGYTREIASLPSRTEFIGLLRRAWKEMGGDPQEPWAPFLTAYEGGRGIVRCGANVRDRTLEVLEGIRIAGPGGGGPELRVRTILTSGTIRKVKVRMGLPPGRKRRRQ